MTTTLRPERPDDWAAITALHQSAFAGHPHSQQTEHLIVLALRAAQALTVSLVAVQGEAVLGHVACSPVSFSDGTVGWHGLGPLAVLPQQQGRGLGQALVRAALATLQAQGAQGCVVLGDPAYYQRFGFGQHANCVLEGVPPEYFQALAFGPAPAGGLVSYHPAFAVPG